MQPNLNPIICSSCWKILYKNAETGGPDTQKHEICLCKSCLRDKKYLKNQYKLVEQQVFDAQISSRDARNNDLLNQLSSLKESKKSQQNLIEKLNAQNYFTIQQSGSILPLFLTKNVAEGMRIYRNLIQEIKQKESYLGNLIKISINETIKSSEAFLSELADKQITKLIAMVKEESKITQKLYDESMKFYQKTKEDMKRFKSLSFLSQSQIGQVTQVNQDDQLHQQQNVVFLDSESNRMLEIIGNRVDKLRAKNIRLNNLSENGAQLLFKVKQLLGKKAEFKPASMVLLKCFQKSDVLSQYQNDQM